MIITLLAPSSPINEGVAYERENFGHKWLEFLNAERHITVIETLYQEVKKPREEDRSMDNIASTAKTQRMRDVTCEPVKRSAFEGEGGVR
jgi:hypothetical protein